MKVAINTCYGGFALSDEAYLWLIENRGWHVTEYSKKGNSYEDPTAQLVNIRSSLLAEEEESMFGSYLPLEDRNSKNFRTNPDIIACIAALGVIVNSDSDTKIIDIPDDIKWALKSSGGKEWIEEEHKTWR